MKFFLRNALNIILLKQAAVIEEEFGWHPLAKIPKSDCIFYVDSITKK